MTYGFRPDNWPVFQAELRKRRIDVADIEKIEMRLADDRADLQHEQRVLDVTVTLRSGRAESWRQLRAEVE